MPAPTVQPKAQRHPTRTAAPQSPPPPYTDRGVVPHGTVVPRRAPAAPRALASPVRASLQRDYNCRLDALRRDINRTMGVGQRHAAKILGIAGTLTSIGGAVAIGCLSMTALVGAASGVGLPVVAAAAIAGAAVGLLGITLTVLLSAWLRSATRKNLKNNPALRERINALRSLRVALLNKPRRTQADRALLKNISMVLGKVEGPGAMIKAQVKIAGWTGLGATLGIVIAAVLAACAAGGIVSEPMLFGGDGGIGSTPMRTTHADVIDLPENQHLLAALAG